MFLVHGGWLGDRFGARNVLTVIVGYWSAMTAATAVASGAASFMVLRFLFGMGEAGAFPGATRAMQLWYPLTALGWRSVFYICGAVGILWSVLWYFDYRNLPEEHELVNEAELRYIRGVDEKGNAKLANVTKKPKVPWRMMLKSPNMWAIMLAYFTYVYCLWIFLSWLPSYLVEFRHFTLLKVGFLASLPLVAGVVGDTVGGLTTDWLLAKTDNIKFSRRVVAITGMFGCAVFFVPAAVTQDAYIAVYCLTASMFFLECTIGPSWAVPMDIGVEVSGTVSGMMNMAGNVLA